MANYCDTCGHQFSDVCGTCESLEGVPVKYTEKGSKTIVPICGTCVSKEHCAVAKCSHYEKRLKLTNADRIRNMSDEELAKFLQEDVFYEPWCPDDVVCLFGEGCQLTDKDCGKCVLKWLKQEVSE